jgi:heat shock protein HtpX
VTLKGRPTVHVTTALLDRVKDRELHAVLAHELGHILHRDAVLMTILAGPSTWAANAARHMIDDDPLRGTLAIVCYVLPLAPVLLVSAVLARLVSRHRELAADRAAVLLTGSAAAVAAALVAVDDELRRMPKTDLRNAQTLSCFSFVPARPPRWWLRFWATHPTVDRRLERLDRFERALQAA